MIKHEANDYDVNTIYEQYRRYTHKGLMDPRKMFLLSFFFSSWNEMIKWIGHAYLEVKYKPKPNG